MKKAFALLVAVLMMLSSSALAYTVSEPGVIPVVDEVVEYTICAPDTTYICDLDENTLTVNVGRLRRKLEAAGLKDFIATKIGVGYIVE